MADETPGLTLLGDALRHRWLLVALIVVTTAAGVYGATRLQADYYDAEAVLAFAPRADSNAGSDIIRVVLPKYSTFATSDRTVRRVATDLGIPSDELDSATSATIAADSGNLSIIVRFESSARAVRSANAIARETLRFSNDDPLVEGVVAAPAVRSDTPSGPPRSLYLMAGVLLGLVLGTAAAFVVEQSRPRLRTPGEISRVTGHRVIGEIPPLSVLRGRPAFAIRDPDAGSAARTLRTNLLRLLQDQPARIIAVTASSPEEGKSTVASLLAAAVARTDTNVLLVDGDLHRPRLIADFALRSTGGLRSVVRGAASLEDEIRGSGIIGLSILPTLEDPQAGDVLTTRIGQVLAEAARHFDLVIVDTPPILGGGDAITLVTAADAVLLVVSTETPTPAVGEATSILDALGVRVLGVVASKMKQRHGSQTFYGYR